MLLFLINTKLGTKCVRQANLRMCRNGGKNFWGLISTHRKSHLKIEFGMVYEFSCTQYTFARAQPLGQARSATIGYLVKYKLSN